MTSDLPRLDKHSRRELAANLVECLHPYLHVSGKDCLGGFSPNLQLPPTGLRGKVALRRVNYQGKQRKEKLGLGRIGMLKSPLSFRVEHLGLH